MGEIDEDELFAQAVVARELADPTQPTQPTQLCPHEDTHGDRKQGAVVCLNCGLVVDSVLCDWFGNTLPLRSIKPRSLYRRKHHFNERLSQWLITTRQVDGETIRRVKELVEGGENGPITKTRIRFALRKLGLAKHIENWIEIYCEITGRPYPVIEGQTLERIREHFLQIEVAFEKHRPAGRKCILSYNFIMSRILQVYNLTEHLKWFPPLKSRAKLRQLDVTWQHMAKSMGLPLIPPPIFNKSLR